MTSSVNDSNLERKFQSVTNTQDSIQSLSLWIIHHKNHAKKVVDVWLKVLKKVKIQQRLVLFYLANDVIQNSKRKGTTLFLEAYQAILPDAAILLKDDNIRGAVQRVLKIWDQRTVYPTQFIDELNGVLNNTKTLSAAVTKIVNEFKPESIIEKIRVMVRTEAETAKKLLALNNTKFDAANSEILRQFKDRKHGQQFSKDFEDATRCLEEYIIAIEKDLAVRMELIQLLEQAEIYYDTQRGEAKIVSNAYKSFSTRVSAQKKRLVEIKKNLPSPFPSPCADAPSPTNSEGIPDFSSVDPNTGSPESEPSPEGTPEDLRLSPPIDPSSQGIPTTVSSFMPQAGMMAFWLEAFQSGSPSSQEQKSSSSLDSRLMSLVNKIPSKGPPFLEQKGIFPLGGDDTPVKDEHSGQETPVLDESGAKLSSNTPNNHRKLANSKSNGGSSQEIKTPESTKIDKNDAVKSNEKDLQSTKTPLKHPSHNGISKSEKKGDEEGFVEPLQPPPMPNFENFSFLDSPPSSNITNLSTKSRIDPRLNSQNYKSNRNDDQSDSFQGEDDTEIMDMELEDSDDEETKKNKGFSKMEETLSPSPNNSAPKLAAQTNSNSKSTKDNNSTNKDLLNKLRRASGESKGAVKVSPGIGNASSESVTGVPANPDPAINNITGVDPLIGGMNHDYENAQLMSAAMPSFSQRESCDPNNKDLRGFSRIETIQTLRNEEWGSEPSWPDMDMPPSMPIPPDEQIPSSYEYELGPPPLLGLPPQLGPPQRQLGPPQQQLGPRAQLGTRPQLSPRPQYGNRNSMPYHRPPPPENDYEYMYNRPNYPPPIHYDGGIPRKYAPPPDKRFSQRPPFRRGRGRGYFNKQY